MSLINKIEKKIIQMAQNQVTKAYMKNGLTDEVLDAQIRLNELRNKYDINDSDDEFVQ